MRHRFGAYFRAEGAAEVENKRHLADRVLTALRQRPNRFAALLGALQPPKEGLRALYLRADETTGQAPTGSESGPSSPDVGRSSAPIPDGGLIDLDTLLGGFGSAPAAGAARESSGDTANSPQCSAANESAVRFVRAVLSYWVGHLKALPEDPHWSRYMGLDKGALEDLIGELITAADRLGLERALLHLIDTAESQAAAMRSQLAERQVYVTASRINRFVDYLGCDDLPPDDRPRSRAGPQRPVFAAPPPIPPGSMPVLPETPVNFSALYIVDWFEAFRALAIANAGHAAGRDISPEQNARLGQILALVAGRSIDAATA
jgi:hypothetical protein